MNNLLLPLTLAISAVLALTCCSSAEAPLPGEAAPRTEATNAGDQRAARALSIGSVQALNTEADQYIQALRCSISLHAINEQLTNSGGISDELERGMRTAEAIYDRQVTRIGIQDGKSRDEMRDDRREQTEQVQDLATRGQIAMGCLRKLTET